MKEWFDSCNLMNPGKRPSKGKLIFSPWQVLPEKKHGGVGIFFHLPHEPGFY
jgi:hypothetical protein